MIFRDHYEMSISQQILRKEGTLSVDFNTYLMIISTKTYTSHVSILLSSVSDKTAAKSAELSRKSFFWTLRRLFAMYFFLAICFVYPVAIPEPFAHSRGIRLLATHSLAQEALMRDTGSLLVCY